MGGIQVKTFGVILGKRTADFKYGQNVVGAEDASPFQMGEQLNLCEKSKMEGQIDKQIYWTIELKEGILEKHILLGLS